MRRCPVLLLLALSCTSATVPPEPPYSAQLSPVVGCDSHIDYGWRTLTARELRGRVMTDRDEPMPQALVAVRKHGDTRIHQTLSDEAGNFAFPGLGPGRYEFVTCLPAMDPDHGWVTISPRAKNAVVDLLLHYGV